MCMLKCFLVVVSLKWTGSGIFCNLNGSVVNSETVKKCAIFLECYHFSNLKFNAPQLCQKVQRDPSWYWKVISDKIYVFERKGFFFCRMLFLKWYESNGVVFDSSLHKKLTVEKHKNC